MFYGIIGLLIAYIIYSKFLSKFTSSKFEDSKLKSYENSKLPYKKKEYILSKAEKGFYEILKLTLKNDNYTIFTKVRLCDLIYIPNNTKDRQLFWNKIKSKHVDFVICDNANLQPALVIELDDSSHNKTNRIERDTFLNKALTDAGLNIVRVNVNYSYNVNELSKLMYNYLSPASASLMGSHESAAATDINDEASSSESIDAPICPKCGVPMVLRTAKKGDKAGTQFYGCPNYPKCREII